MIRTHGANSIFNGYEYLSYFNKFNLSSKVDHPIVGGAMEWTGLNAYALSSNAIDYNGISYPSLKITETQNSNDYNDQTNVSLNKGSIELLLEMSHISNTFNFLGLGALQICSMNELLGNDYGVSFVLNKTMATIINAFSSVKRFEDSEYYWASIGKNWAPMFVSYSIDGNKARLYIDGQVCVEIQGSVSVENIIVSPRKLNSVNISQLALFKNSKSFGNNYPVSSKPYYPLNLL